MKLVIRKVVQYAKCGGCAKKTPVPPEVAWFSVRSRDDKDSRARLESLLTVDEVKAIMAAAENERGRAMISVLFEAGLRPGELLSMKVGGVFFNNQLLPNNSGWLDWVEAHSARGKLQATTGVAAETPA